MLVPGMSSLHARCTWTSEGRGRLPSLGAEIGCKGRRREADGKPFAGSGWHGVRRGFCALWRLLVWLKALRGAKRATLTFPRALPCPSL